MPRSDHSRWWIAAEIALALALVVTPWSFGGAPAWTLWLVLALAATAVLTWTIGASKHHRRWSFHPVLWLPALAVLLCVVQLLPLPPPLLAVLSAPAAELREFTLVPLGFEGWRPITFDVPATSRALGRFIALGGLLFVSLELGRLEAVRWRLLALQALMGVAVAVVGFGHLLAGAEALFGAHHFTATLTLITPFGNTNHLAAYLALSGTVALGLAVATKSRDVAIGWAAAALVCGVAVFLSMSRGGIATFVATWVLVGAALLAARGGGLRAVVPWVVMGATVLFAALFAFEQLVSRAETVATAEKVRATKVELWPMLWEGELKTWPLGMGAGAFELGFARWQTQQPDVTFTHPENIVLQALADWGLPVTAVLLLASLWLVRRLWVSVWSMPLERTALLALVGLLLHDVFDFSLELQALAVAASVLLGVVAGSASRSERLRVGWRGPLYAGAVLGVAAVALWTGQPAHTSAEQALRQAITERRPVDDVRAQAVRLVRRHPADWVLYADTATDLSRRGAPREALAWINRWLFLRPADPRARLAAAQALLRLNQPMQALGELRAAFELGDGTAVDLAIAVAARHHAWDRILVDRPGHLTTLWQRAKSLEQAQAMLDAAEVSAAGDVVRQEAMVLRVQQAARGGDLVAALAAWERLPESERASLPQQLLRADLLGQVGRGDEALALLETLGARWPNDLTLSMRLVDAYAARGRPVAARETLERARPFFSGPAQRSTLFQREAALLMAEQRWGRALEALQTAARIEPTRADLHYRMAEVYERMGSLHSAIDAIRRGRLLDSPEGAKAQDGNLARLEALMLAQ